MKYMGSKRGMLQNGLGDLLRKESTDCKRVVDLFSGSASVSWFAAQELAKPVFAVDLQQYAKALAQAVIERVKPLISATILNQWLPLVQSRRRDFKVWSRSAKLDRDGINTVTWSRRARDLCEDNLDAAGPVWKAYGGYYFSPTQALTFDAMRVSLPSNEQQRAACLAAIIIAASKCVASPGHTAQPFKANTAAGRFLREAWERDPILHATEALRDVCQRHAKHRGATKVADANQVVSQLRADDLVFVDPPYSGVHYSRFYHVLETLARGRCGKVEGTGRYPDPEYRPTSCYSRQTESKQAIEELVKSLAKIGCKVVLTFPAVKCSNGLSGHIVEKLAKQHFQVSRKTVNTRFSTLGGNNDHRAARKMSPEMILLLRSA